MEHQQETGEPDSGIEEPQYKCSGVLCVADGFGQSPNAPGPAELIEKKVVLMTRV